MMPLILKLTVKKAPYGFTLSELLIALVILGLIATFTIPKVLQSQQSSQFNSVAKEVVGMVSGAYQAYQNNSSATASTGMTHMTPFMNYVKVNSTSLIDDYPTATTLDCSSDLCLLLHNGSMLRISSTLPTFGGTSTTNAIAFEVDPDAKVSSVPVSTGGPGKAVKFFLYFNGRIATYGTITPNTCDSDTCRSPNPSRDPSWFSW